MDNQSITAIKEILKLLQKCEIGLSKLYKACSEKWPEDKGFFDDMATSEIKHSGYIKTMESLIDSVPQSFEKGRPISKEEINIMIEGADYYASKVKDGTMPKLDLLKSALKLEDSVIERKYSEILRSSNFEYRKLLQRIIADTLLHKSLLEEKIKSQL